MKRITGTRRWVWRVGFSFSICGGVRKEIFYFFHWKFGLLSYFACKRSQQQTKTNRQREEWNSLLNTVPSAKLCVAKRIKYQVLNERNKGKRTLVIWVEFYYLSSFANIHMFTRICCFGFNRVGVTANLRNSKRLRLKMIKMEMLKTPTLWLSTYTSLRLAMVTQKYKYKNDVQPLRNNCKNSVICTFDLANIGQLSFEWLLGDVASSFRCFYT